ncbi:hypothetical protein DICPUDRAFT_150416 [Dictyostelium purpureum]|uniref:Mediator of RNA polymerase II transcription subunit 14 n=1 Tax=Dictyostelium purpureum TaxID=5786 RepID=F0ZGA0_DICPU|nr:uncharacterized protein DICPUDRAFT_150416 [Dictyostelium purpureum]EGC37024.1 hypothetical protein DICPUDRAFT_150416 [Dictyostelium purpureum]|eukprot:XP_003286452.1 hypothetical protein DICPUDRAFT_150416 [Dictyostelium purpureum]
MDQQQTQPPQQPQQQIPHPVDPNLPIQSDLQNGNISLSLVIHRLVEQSYNNLLGLTENLPKANDLERKKALVDYLDGTREKFLRLLVLMKWSEHVPTLTKANNIINLLNQEDSYFREAADSLINTQYGLVNARAPIYDVPTAIDVLTTGTYQRMPTSIKKVIPPPMLKPSQIDSTLQRLDDIIKYKLFISSIPKEFEPIQVAIKIEISINIFLILSADGKAHIVVKDEYDVYITIDGGSEKSNWLILSLNLFVYSKRNSSGEGPIQVAYDERIRKVIERVQNRISSSPNPLYELHNIIHYLCISSQMDILASQVENLKKTILKNNIRCVFGKDQSITVFYWLPEDINLIGVTQTTLGNLNPSKNTNFKIFIDDSQKIKISHFPPVVHPKNDNYFNISNLNIETILLQAIELNAYHKVFHLYGKLLDSKLSDGLNTNQNASTRPTNLLMATKQQQNNSILNRSFHLNDVKLIMSSRFSDENQSISNHNDHLPTVLRVMLYGSKFLDVSVNFTNGKFSLIKSSNYIELTSHLEQKLNNNPNEIKSIVNIFKLKSLLTCFEEASLFLGLECFYKIPLQLTNNNNSNNNQIANELFSESNFICISLPKETDPIIIVISIKANCFTPSFHLLFCKLLQKSTIMTLESIIKLENESLSNLLKDCPIGGNSNNRQPFQTYVSKLLEKIIEASNQKINLLSIQSYLKKENINFIQPPSISTTSSTSPLFISNPQQLLSSPSTSSPSSANSTPTLLSSNPALLFSSNQLSTSLFSSPSDDNSIVFFFDEKQIEKVSPFLKNHITPQTPITVVFNKEDYFVSFTQQRPFQYKRYNNDILKLSEQEIEYENHLISNGPNYSYNNGNWVFKYPKTSDWLNHFHSDLLAISKISNISSQLLKQIETLENYKQLITLVSVKPMEIEFICSIESPKTCTNIRFFIDKTSNDIQIGFNPYTNPLVNYFAKDINQSPNNDITNALRAIINSNDISIYINGLISPLEITLFLPLEILVIPRSLYQIRLLYKNLYGIDIKLISHEYCAIGDSFYSLNASKQVRLTSINQLHSFMEQRISLQALDNPLGHRTFWLLPIKQFLKTVNRIFIYLHSLNTFKNTQGLMKNYFILQSQVNAHINKFSNEYYLVNISIRDFTHFEFDMRCIKDDILKPEEIDTFRRYFKKKILSLSYRNQALSSCIQMLTLPPFILSEIIRLLLEITGPKFDGFTIELCLNTSNVNNQKSKESFFHNSDEKQIYLILRYLTSIRNENASVPPQDQFLDIPIIYNYSSDKKSFQYWNKGITDLNLTKKLASPFDDLKKKYVEEVGKTVIDQITTILVQNPNSKPNPLSLFFKAFLEKVKLMLSNQNNIIATSPQ